MNDALQSNLALAVGVIGVALLLLLLLAVVQAVRIRRITRRLNALTRGSDGRSIEAVLADHLDTVLRVRTDLGVVRGRVASVEASLPKVFQHVGVVRFNPFQDTGGNQSFALAMLDGAGTGFVLSSLHSRSGTRVYAKAVKEGRCDTALSAEEEQAMQMARAAKTPAVEPEPQAEPAPVPAAGLATVATGRNMQARPVAVRQAAGADEALDAGFLERRLHPSGETIRDRDT